MSKGCDFSFDKPNGKLLKAAGFTFVVGYVSGNKGKDISKSQMEAYRADGLGVGFVYEGTGREPLSLSELKHGVAVGNSIMNSFGVPTTVPLFVASDFQPNSGQENTISSNINAARATVSRPVGLYGDYALGVHCLAHKSLSFFWQTYAWSSGHRDPRFQLYQYSNGHRIDGGTVDYDTEYHEGALWAAEKPAQRDLRLGDSGADVKKLQEKLKVVADGEFGPKTLNAVVAFQKAHHLTADGVVGPITRKALGL